MDVIKSPNSTSGGINLKQAWLSISVALVCCIVLYIIFFKNSISVDKNTLVIDQVKYGNLEMTVEGYGQLKSAQQSLITAFSEGVVKELLLKPGAFVDENTVILKLENLELQRKVREAEQLVAQAQENLQQQKLTNQREILNEQASLEESQAEYEISKLKTNAEEKLVKQGIVSQLTFQSSILNTTRLKNKYHIAKKKFGSLQLVHKSTLNILAQKVEQSEDELRIATINEDNLSVKAGFMGRLQRISVEHGQSVTAGQILALIGSETDLIAELQVPQSQAQEIAVGQPAVIDTRRDKILGEVAIIDPIVAKNTVRVEIKLTDPIPSSARPFLNIDGIITTKKMANVTFINRPAQGNANSTQNIFRLLPQGGKAEQISVTFGVKSGPYMQITAGAATGDQLIISDLTNIAPVTTDYISLN